MDSWNPKQLSLMKIGGNDKCAAFLKSKGVPPGTTIKQKYESPAAQLYKEVLKARVEGRPEPTELPKPAVRTPPGSGNMPAVGKPGEDPMGMERLTGETDQQYIARQTRLRDEAKARMAKKFGGGGMGGVGSGGSSRMAGIGSDPNYNPHGGYGGGASDINLDSLVSGFGSALTTVGAAASGAARSASAVIQDKNTQQTLMNVGNSMAATGASFWNSFSSSVQNVAASISQPDSDGMEDFNRQMASQRSATASKYSGFGSDGTSYASTMQLSMPTSAAGPSSTLQEAQGLPGEDRNGIERLTGESDEQYVMRQTRLRDEAKARMAAKFGGGGLSAASSNVAPAPSSGNSLGFAQPPSNPSPTTTTTTQQPVQTHSAPSSGNWGGTGGPTQPKNLSATKMKVKAASSDDFFSSFGA
mmetsp:Transcript_33283/g.76705  ORF Transcript_33283/g.76705 Transcript_33283/m.76705 type:complete len:415 (-) Transcript_33283:96-1340(-)